MVPCGRFSAAGGLFAAAAGVQEAAHVPRQRGIEDVGQSPALDIPHRFDRRGAHTSYSGPRVPRVAAPAKIVLL